MAKITIDKKIVKFAVAKDEAEKSAQPDREEAKVIRMHEKLERPEMLIGSTYKVKTPVSDHAMYVTINDIVLNEGTKYEQRRPFEIFINSKNLDHYQWIVALTRIMSAVFRKGGDVTFLVDELKAVFDPRGGYWQPGGKFMPSIIAELGHIVENHLILIHCPLVEHLGGDVLGDDVNALAARFVQHVGEQPHLKLKAQHVHAGDVLLAAFQDHLFDKQACHW